MLRAFVGCELQPENSTGNLPTEADRCDEIWIHPACWLVRQRVPCRPGAFLRRPDRSPRPSKCATRAGDTVEVTASGTRCAPPDGCNLMELSAVARQRAGAL